MQNSECKVEMSQADSFAFRTLHSRFLHFAALKTVGADAHPLGRSADPCANRTQINVPAAVAHVVSVADIVSKLRLLAANIANLCHCLLQVS